MYAIDAQTSFVPSSLGLEEYFLSIEIGLKVKIFLESVFGLMLIKSILI